MSETTEAENVLQSRTFPEVVVVDATLAIASASSGVDALLESIDASRETLPRAVCNAIAMLATGGMKRPMAIVEGPLVFRIIALDGPEPARLFAIIVERLQSREPLRRAVRQYNISRRESDVVRLLLLGYSTQRIASELDIAESTVQDHVKHVAAKTHSRSRSEIVAKILGAK